MQPISAQRLRHFLDYAPATGCFRWRVKPARRIAVGSIAGSVTKGHLTICIEGTSYQSNRLAWLYMTDEWPSGVVDHQDGDGLNDRWGNLRDVTNQVNVQNQRQAARHNRSTGLLGASFYARIGKFIAQIQADGKRHFIGYFDTAEQAHEAYVVAKRRLHPGCTL